MAGDHIANVGTQTTVSAGIGTALKTPVFFSFFLSENTFYDMVGKSTGKTLRFDIRNNVLLYRLQTDKV